MTIKTAKVGEQIAPKAMAKLRRSNPRIFGRLDTRESVTVQPKSDAKTGQWC